MDKITKSDTMKYVNSVSVSPKTLALKVGDWFYDVEAEVCPEDADLREVRWCSDNPDVASVNEITGYICANAVGTATIYATAADGSDCSDYITVTVSNTIPVTSVTLSKTQLVIEKGHTSTLYATVKPNNATNKNVEWTSSNNSVATVSDGVVTALAYGNATITATATDGSGKRASCSVSVTNNVLVSSICFPEETKTMVVGESEFVNGTVYPENAENSNVVLISDDPSVATVNEFSGLVYAQNEGSTVIRAVAQDGSGTVGTYNVNVRQAIPVQCISLNKENLPLKIGGSFALRVSVYPENATATAIIWQSSDPHIASVNSSTGVVTGVSAGETRIGAYMPDSHKSASCLVTVEQIIGEDGAEEPNVDKTGNGTVADPVDAYSGSHLIKNTLMSLLGGQGIKFTAHYNSSYSSLGTLGKGWYHNYEKYIKVEQAANINETCNDDCGDDSGSGNNSNNVSEILVYSSPSTFAKYVVDSNNANRFICSKASKNGYVLTVDKTKQYPYTINCNSMMTECYDANGKLAKIIDHQGFETLISHSNSQITITDGVSGKKIYLDKNSSGRIVSVRDDAGREAKLTYTNDRLTSIRDVNGNTLTFTYNSDNQILTGTDSKGTCYFTNTYDAYGRVSKQKDGISGSLNTLFSYNECSRISTNRNGKRSVREYNEDGLLTLYTDENGNNTSYEYDEHYNIIKETDAEGRSIIKVYNSFNKPTEITDRNGNKTTLTYDNAGNVTKICYPAINGVIPEETFVYNSRNQVTQHTDIRGTVTVYTYDTNGMPATKKVGNKNAIVYVYEGGLLKSQTDAMGNTTRYTHNALGQISSMTDADNNVTEYFYDNIGNLLRTVDANGKSTVMTYDCNGQKITAKDANGNTTSYAYNGNMKNTSVTFPDGKTMRYEYDGEDRAVKITDRANNVTNITYDDAGRMLTKRFSDGGTVQYEYDKVGNAVKETNPKSAVTVKTYDGLGNVLTVTDDDGNVTSYEYNAMSKVTKVTNAMAGNTVYVYSKAGDLLSETDPLGNTKTYTYDAFGNRLTATDAKNNVTTYTYDQNNNLLTVKDALNNTTTYTYDALNRCVSVKDALNNVIRYGYDALGRRTTITDARGNVFTTFYDGNGNVIKTTDAKGNTISETTYNNLNLATTVKDSMGKTTTYTYNEIGKVASVVDPLNHRTEYVHDSRGQNTSVRDASSNTSTAAYDLLGNVTRLAGPLGGATNYTYDDMGRLTSESTVSGGTKSYEYNELNVRKKITNARSQIRQIFHDAAGRITGYTSPEGSVSYTYDANGNVLTVTDSHGTITRTYDALNRVSSYTDTYGKVIRYEYDAVGNITKVTYPDNTAVTYAYDANRNLIRVTDWNNRVTSYTYDVNNRVTGVTKPDGSVIETVYDNMQRVTSTVERTAGGTVITGFEYTYDDMSRIVEEKNLANGAEICYTYDSLGRVTSRAIDAGVEDECGNAVVVTENYSYDAAGNLTSAPDTTFAYGTNNRLTQFNGSSVSYDLDGNMLNNGAMTCTYDSANRLLTAGGHTYTYNAEDVRIRNLCTGNDTTYTYDTNCRLSRLLCKTTNGVTTKYVYGRGLIGEETSGAFKTYHFDCRGSTVAITNASGNITDTFAYDTYGKLLSRTGNSTVIFGYNGCYGVITDANGLVYMRARYYSPDMRRFVNTDIIRGWISNAITLNRFAYANGNPVSFIDPMGLMSEEAYRKKLENDEKRLHPTPKTDTSNISNYNKLTLNEEQKHAIEEAVEPSVDTPDEPTVTAANAANTARKTREDRYAQSTIHGKPTTSTTLYKKQTLDEKKFQNSVKNFNTNIKYNVGKSDSENVDVATGETNYTAGLLYDVTRNATKDIVEDGTRNYIENTFNKIILSEPRPNNIDKGSWSRILQGKVDAFSKSFKLAGLATDALFSINEILMNYNDNVTNGESDKEIISDIAIGFGEAFLSMTAPALIGTLCGIVVTPFGGILIGMGISLVANLIDDLI